MIENNLSFNDNPYEDIEWTDGDVTTKCANILYQYQDYVVYYAYTYVNFRLDDFVNRGFYQELGPRGDNVSAFVCIGNHNMCVCFLNAESKHVVRQFSVNYFMVTGIEIDERRLETSIKVHVGENDYLELVIPNKAIGTKLQFQKQMKQNITEFLYNIDKIHK